MDINNYSDEDLKQLMEKYKEKQERYSLMYNEATIRNERIILNIHLEQIRRFREKHINAYRDTKFVVPEPWSKFRLFPWFMDFKKNTTTRFSLKRAFRIWYLGLKIHSLSFFMPAQTYRYRMFFSEK